MEDSQNRGYVTYEKMVGYVDGRLRPITEHAAEHDQWHLAQIQAVDNARRAERARNIANIIAALAVIMAMVSVFAAHIG